MYWVAFKASLGHWLDMPVTNLHSFPLFPDSVIRISFLHPRNLSLGIHHTHNYKVSVLWGTEKGSDRKNNRRKRSNLNEYHGNLARGGDDQA